MKYLLVILVVLLVVWLTRSGRRVLPPSPGEGAGRGPVPPVHQAMVACAHCGLHLPRDEALPGRGGLFCGEAHRAAYEKVHPTS
jgi:uncharacterized protein